MSSPALDQEARSRTKAALDLAEPMLKKMTDRFERACIACGSDADMAAIACSEARGVLAKIAELRRGQE